MTFTFSQSYLDELQEAFKDTTDNINDGKVDSIFMKTDWVFSKSLFFFTVHNLQRCVL